MKNMLNRKATLRMTWVAVIILCSGYVVSCASLQPGAKMTPLEELQAEIRETVPDKARAEAMFKAVDRMVISIGKLNEIKKLQRKQLDAQILDYSTTREALEAALSLNLKKRQDIADELLKAHYEFKEQSTAKEWKLMVKKEKSALSWIVQHIREDSTGMKGGA